ncbi:hypothetical protein PUR61_07730 [Streptomyces sp. BE20]|uniref:hypothetical protein n=1 Tax=Streptomyces sp. BE20 TaxID=3002525 RepID=UPI002E75A694|nr:hypothetical protein [Streptomyces sp. BE20]MEE1822081.1 hypothetical protein [Streptomyces sp. BE20]
MTTDLLVDEAWRRATPPARLRELAADPALARIVASRIGLPADLAEELAVRAEAGGDVPRWTPVARALAAQPATAPARLARLSAHPDEGVRRAAAVHRATPRRAVKALAADPAVAVRRALAAREKLPRSVAAVLVADPCADVRLTVARRVGARPEELDALVGDPDPRVRRVLTALGRSSAADLADPDPRVRRTAVERRGHRDLAPVLDTLAGDPDPAVRALVATRWRNHDPVSLARLADDPDPRVRAAAADNWYTPVAQLTALAADPDRRVLAELSDNRLAPPAALTRLADTLAGLADDDTAAGREPDPEEREERRRLVHAVLGHPATPPETLRRLHALELNPYFHEGNAMSQPNWPADLLIGFGLDYSGRNVEGEAERASFDRIERAVGTQPPEQVLAAMVGSPVYYLSRAVANRHVPPEALAEYARAAALSPEGHDLDDLARNPAAPRDVLLGWAAENRYCSTMMENPELPVPVLAAIAGCSDDDHAAEARDLLEVRTLRAAARGETGNPC